MRFGAILIPGINAKGLMCQDMAGGSLWLFERRRSVTKVSAQHALKWQVTDVKEQIRRLLSLSTG